MQASVETLNDLERRVTVRVPAEQVAKETKDRLVSLCRRAKVDGFRPGKVPMKVAERLYGDQVRYDTLSELVESSLREALTQENLQPLATPRVEPKNFEDGGDLEYTATFEIVPEFEISGFDQISVERPVAEVAEFDIDRMIASLRQQRATWHAVDRPAEKGDRVRIDFDGTIADEPFAGGQGKNTELVLGKGTMLEGFENALLGQSTGADVGCDLTFPENYQAKEVAGKAAHFAIHVNTVEEAHLPEVDDAFAEHFDVKEGGVPALRQSLRETMERELREATERSVKDQALNGLVKVNTIPLPQTLIRAEIEQLARQMRLPEGPDNEYVQQLKQHLFAEEARRRVALGLMISRLAITQNIELDNERVVQHLHQIAASYEDPESVIRFYQQTPKAIDNVRAMVLEEQVVDWLLERATVTEKTCAFSDVVVNRGQSPAAE